MSNLENDENFQSIIAEIEPQYKFFNGLSGTTLYIGHEAMFSNGKLVDNPYKFTYNARMFNGPDVDRELIYKGLTFEEAATIFHLGYCHFWNDPKDQKRYYIWLKENKND